jgi:homoserine O-succinyltransferase
MLNHLEYDNRSLADEYDRDVKAGLEPGAAGEPVPRRRPDGGTGEPLAQPRHLLFQNWINEIYQTTPYDISRIGDGDN